LEKEVIVLVLREVEVELEVHGIAVFPDIQARVESSLGGVIVKLGPSLVSHVQVKPSLQPQDHKSPVQGVISPRFPSARRNEKGQTVVVT
jgi:hypothetical protein